MNKLLLLLLLKKIQKFLSNI